MTETASGIAIVLLSSFILSGCAGWKTEVKGDVHGPGHYAGYIPTLAGAKVHFIRAF